MSTVPSSPGPIGLNGTSRSPWPINRCGLQREHIDDRRRILGDEQEDLNMTTKLTKDQVHHTTAILDDYMKRRAAAESVEYKLSPQYFEEPLRAGIWTFFGVRVNPIASPYGNGIISDSQNPAFLKIYAAEIDEEVAEMRDEDHDFDPKAGDGLTQATMGHAWHLLQDGYKGDNSEKSQADYLRRHWNDTLPRSPYVDVKPSWRNVVGGLRSLAAAVKQGKVAAPEELFAETP